MDMEGNSALIRSGGYGGNYFIYHYCLEPDADKIRSLRGAGTSVSVLRVGCTERGHSGLCSATDSTPFTLASCRRQWETSHEVIWANSQEQEPQRPPLMWHVLQLKLRERSVIDLTMWNFKWNSTPLWNWEAIRASHSPEVIYMLNTSVPHTYYQESLFRLLDLFPEFLTQQQI